MVIVDEGRRNLAKCLRGTNARQVIVDELADAGVRFNSRALWAGVDYTSLTHCPYCGAEVER